MTRGVLGLGVLLALGVGCGSSERDEAAHGVGTFTDEMPEDLPAGECRMGETDAEDCESGSSSTGGEGSAAGQGGGAGNPECTTTEDCEGAGACAAAWEDGSRTSFVCRFACIPTLDENAWCRDDASCCDPDAVCTGRGYCVLPESAEDSAGSDEIVGSPKLSGEMPEDLPAGGGTRDSDVEDLP
ncbi:MAG: hypothetical protein KUG77_22650 [Nannocystaceae bacterium]|nr:hypothetical protein [Nannocystaceae bacterium]